AKGGDLFREPLAAAAPEAFRPVDEGRASRLVQTGDLVVGQAARETVGRQPGAMQYLIGVGVADAAEQSGIGEGPLERVALASEALANPTERPVEPLPPSPVQPCEIPLAGHDMERGPLLRSRFGQEQRPVVEIERRQAETGRYLRPGLLPPQSSRYHQMDDDE